MSKKSWYLQLVIKHVLDGNREGERRMWFTFEEGKYNKISPRKGTKWVLITLFLTTALVLIMMGLRKTAAAVMTTSWHLVVPQTALASHGQSAAGSSFYALLGNES